MITDFKPKELTIDEFEKLLGTYVVVCTRSQYYSSSIGGIMNKNKNGHYVVQGYLEKNGTGVHTCCVFGFESIQEYGFMFVGAYEEIRLKQ